MKKILCAALLFACVSSAGAGELPLFDGLVEPKEVIEFSSQISGIIEKMSVERGDWVKRGQVLVTLKSGVEKAAVEVALARVKFAERKLVRNEQLYQKKLISTHDKDELETEIQLAHLELEEARERLALRTIKSTINGVVVKREGAPGEYVGEEDSFLTIAQLDPLYVEIVVPDEYLGLIKKGAEADVQLQTQQNVSRRAKVVIVDDVLDAASSTFGVRLELENADLKLPVGVKCQVVF